MRRATVAATATKKRATAAKVTKPACTTENIYSVPAAKWRKWCPYARRLFNDLYGTLVVNKSLFLHPKQEDVLDRHWGTTAWNAAWMAADYAQENLENYDE